MRVTVLGEQILACMLRGGIDVSPAQAELRAASDKLDWNRIIPGRPYDWFGVSLTSADGDYRTVGYSTGEMRPTEISLRFPAAMKLAESVPGISRRVRFALLPSGGHIPEHTDGEIDDEVRLQIPIVTNPGARLTIGGATLTMAEGELWYLDVSQPHLVRNDGDTGRVHLLIDKRLTAEERRWLTTTMSQTPTTSRVRSATDM